MKKKVYEKPKVFSIYMSAADYRQITVDAKAMGYSISAFLRELWKDYKEKNK